MAKMNLKIKNAWIKALLSGKFKKIKKKLHNGKEQNYCALGVLQHLYNKEHKGNEIGMLDEGSLDESVAQWAGFTDSHTDGVDVDGTFSTPFLLKGKKGDILDEYSSIPELNDSPRNFSFACIAKVIKEKF